MERGRPARKKGGFFLRALRERVAWTSREAAQSGTCVTGGKVDAPTALSLRLARRGAIYRAPTL